MTGTQLTIHPSIPHEVKVRPVLGNNLEIKIQDAVAWRAFALYEQQGCVPGRDVENWQQAYADVVRPLDCGVVVHQTSADLPKQAFDYLAIHE